MNKTEFHWNRHFLSVTPKITKIDPCFFFKVTQFYDYSHNLDEQKLIENRLNRTLEPNHQICPYHRYSLGVSWKQSKTCNHPQRISEKGKKAPPVHSVPIYLTKLISKKYNIPFPIGSVFCQTHLKEERKNETFSDVETENITPSALPDPDFVSDEVLISNEQLEKSKDQGNIITETLECSPVQFKLKRKVELIDDNTKKGLSKKFKKLEDSLRLKYAESVAPGQEEEFIAQVLSISTNDQENEKIPDHIQCYLQLYKESDALGKMVILSLLDQSFSKNIMKIFNCAKYRIDLARKWRDSHQGKGLCIPEKNKFIRHRLNCNKSEHFLDFIFSSGMLQDVAYGVTKIRYDSGEEQKVAHAILTTKFSHAIAFYIESCKIAHFSPLSESSLWKILHAIKPSQRKSLAGLDDITASGMNAFNTLEKLASNVNRRDLVNSLESSKHYLKTHYQHCCDDSNSSMASHSPKFALSDPNEQNLQEQFILPSRICKKCYILCETIEQIQNLVNVKLGQDANYDVEIAVQNIHEYIKHLMRDSQQKKAKSEAFDKLSESAGFWLKDFCQKIIPVKFREGQKEYFGKKGMSLHVDIFFYKVSEEQIKKQIYFTIIYRCDQSTADVAVIADVVLDQFRKDLPKVTNLCTKSDNAGCYHGNHSAEAIYILCRQKGIKLLRYDYNEPCCGKDLCDCENAAAKSIIRSFIDSGNDLLSGDDLFKALHYGYGMKDSKVALIQVDTTNTVITGDKISNITNYHSTQFHNDHIILWHYFGIGIGIKLKYSSIMNIKTSAKILKCFSDTESIQRKKEQFSKKREDRTLNNILHCSTVGCAETFAETLKLEEHMLSGKHSIPEQISSFDQVKKSFTEKMKLTSQHHLTSSSASKRSYCMTTS